MYLTMEIGKDFLRKEKRKKQKNLESHIQG